MSRGLRSALVWVAALVLAACAGAPRPGLNDGAEGTKVAPALRRELHAVTEALHRAGMHERSRGLAGFMLAGSHATLPLYVAAGECVTVLARATSGARDIDAALYSAEGRLLALDSGASARPAVQACAVDAAVRAYYVIQFYDGDGSFIALPFYGPRSALRAASAAVGGKPALAEIVSAPEVSEEPANAFSEGLRKRGFDAVGEPRRFQIAQGERVRASLPVETGQCYTVAVFGGAGIGALRLRLLDTQGAAASVADESAPHAAAQLCARETAPYVVESESTAGAGEAVVVVYRVDVLTAGGDAGLWLGHRAQNSDPVPSAKQPSASGQTK